MLPGLPVKPVAQAKARSTGVRPSSQPLARTQATPMAGVSAGRSAAMELDSAAARLMDPRIVGRAAARRPLNP